MARGVAIALAISAGASTAAAQTAGSWAVVVTHVGQRSPDASHAAELAASALRSRGATVVDQAHASDAIERGLGHAPEPLPPDLQRDLEAGDVEVLEHAAFGRTEDALAQAEPLFTRANQRLDAVARDDAARAHLANICLYAVRVLLHDRRESEARARALECARLPYVTPDARAHPPAVRELFETTRAAIADGPHGTLAIGDAPGCEVHVNGNSLGPAGVERAFPPGRYEISIACGSDRPARVHRVEVAEGGRVEIDPRAGLVARLDVGTALELRYTSEPERNDELASDATALGGLFNATDVLAVSADRAAVTLTHLHVDRERDEALIAGSVQLTSDEASSLERIREAVSALLEGEAAVSDTPGVDRGGWSPVGLTLGGVGLAGIIAAWALYGTWIGEQRQVDALPMMFMTEIDLAIAARNERGRIVLAAGAASAAVLTAAVPFLLRPRDGVPWWSWLAGIAGLATVVGGIVHSAFDQTAVDDRGVFVRTVPLGPLVAMHGAPLLAVLLTHLVRAAIGSNATIATGSDGETSWISVGARF